MKRLLRLYPRAWRDLHEAEVGQMLDDTGSGIADAPDLIRGAIDAHAHPTQIGLPPGRLRRWLTPVHLAGLAALTGATLWFSAWSMLVASVLLARFGWEPFGALSVKLSIAADALVVVGMVGLMAWRSGSRVRLASGTAAVIVATIAVSWHLAGSLVKLKGGWGGGPYLNPYTVVYVASVLAVLAIWGRPGISRRALALVLGSAIMGTLLQRVAWWDVDGVAVIRVVAYAVSAACAGLFPVAWMWVGWSAMRSPTPSGEFPDETTSVALA